MPQTVNEQAAKLIHVTVYFRLSAEGQKAAILAGKNAATDQEVEGDIAAELLSLCQINDDGTVVANLRSVYGISREGEISVSRSQNWATVRPLLDNPPESAESAIITVRDLVAARAAEVKAAYEEARERQRLENEKTEAERRMKLDAAAAIMANDPEAIPELPYDIMQCPGFPEVVEIIRRKDAKEKREKQSAEKAAREKAAERQRTITAWVARHGTEDQKERFAEGLLPEKEAIDCLTELALVPSGATFLPFAKITEAEVRNAVDELIQMKDGAVDDTIREREPQFRSSQADELTADQWRRLKELRALLPGATVTPMLHEATVNHRDVPWGVVTRYGAMAVINFGGIELRREYAL